MLWSFIQPSFVRRKFKATGTLMVVTTCLNIGQNMYAQLAIWTPIFTYFELYDMALHGMYQGNKATNTSYLSTETLFISIIITSLPISETYGHYFTQKVPYTL